MNNTMPSENISLSTRMRFLNPKIIQNASNFVNKKNPLFNGNSMQCIDFPYTIQEFYAVNQILIYHTGIRCKSNSRVCLGCVTLTCRT